MSSGFDGAKVFGKVAAVLLIAALLTVPYIGFWMFLPVGIALYFLLYFANRLEEADRQDRKRKR
jgi:hypothetical protein